jgi:hypothetical protein
MPDSSAIDQALVAKLGSDATLLSLCPNGVYVDEAPPGSKQFVIVSLVIATDESEFGGRGFEDVLYLVKAVELSTVATKNIRAAAARIDDLLEDGELSIPGYSLMVMQRTERIRMTEVDEMDASIRWFHRGGRYQVVVSPA